MQTHPSPIDLRGKDRRYVKNWILDIEKKEGLFSYTVIKLRGRFVYSYDLKDMFHKMMEKVVLEEKRIVFDFGEVGFACSIFLNYFLQWAKDQGSKECFIGVTRVPFFLREIMKSLKFQGFLRELPAHPSQWTHKMMSPKKSFSFVLRIKKWLSSHLKEKSENEQLINQVYQPQIAVKN